MKRTIPFLAFFIFFLNTYAQDTTVTIFFKSGQSRLTPSQQQLIDQLQKKPVTKITVDGYADTVGKAAFNKKLSLKRAQTIAKPIKTENKNIVGRGESTEKKVALNKMRKVVVKVWYDKPVVVEKPIEEIPPPKVIPVAKVDSCKEDTVLFSPSGNRIELNKCFYLENKSCFSFNEYLTAKAVQESGLRTVDVNNNPIESGGMIDVRFCSDTCTKKPIIVFIPVPSCLKNQQMTLWNLTTNNRWRNTKNKISVVQMDGKDFYRLEVFCPGKINLDKPKLKRRGYVKIHLKDDLKIKSASLSTTCPLYSVDGKLRKRKTVAVFQNFCPYENPLLYLKAYSKNGDTLIIHNENINQYTRKKKLRSGCRCYEEPKERFLGIFKIHKRYIYRKYKIYRKDF